MVKITDLEVSLNPPATTDQVAVIDERGVVRRWPTVGEWEARIRADERARVRKEIQGAKNVDYALEIIDGLS